MAVSAAVGIESLETAMSKIAAHVKDTLTTVTCKMSAPDDLQHLDGLLSDFAWMAFSFSSDSLPGSSMPDLHR